MRGWGEGSALSFCVDVQLGVQLTAYRTFFDFHMCNSMKTFRIYTLIRLFFAA